MNSNISPFTPPIARSRPKLAASSWPKPLLLLLSQSSGYRAALVAKGLLESCNEHNYSFLWRSTPNYDPAVLALNPAGIVTWAQAPMVRRLMRSTGGRIPLVSTHGCTLEMPISTVSPDSGAIAGMLAEHLIGEGFENFIFVGSRNGPSARWRADAFEAAVARRTLAFRCQFFDVPRETRLWDGETGRGGALVRLLRRTPLPVAIVAMNDRIAISCIECVRAAGLNIPQQVSIVGSDDHPVYASMYPLTTVRIDYQGIGRLAASMIDDRRHVTEPKPAPVERRFVGGELVVRKSSQLRLVDEPRIAKAVEFMHERFHEEITVGQLARISGMSRANFATKFVEATGQSPIQYLIDYRMEKSKALLMRTDLNISEVGARVGFGNQSYFGRTFRKYLGVTPRQFQELRAAGGKVKPKAEARTAIMSAAQNPTSRQIHSSHAA